MLRGFRGAARRPATDCRRGYATCLGLEEVNVASPRKREGASDDRGRGGNDARARSQQRGALLPHHPRRQPRHAAVVEWTGLLLARAAEDLDLDLPLLL